MKFTKGNPTEWRSSHFKIAFICLAVCLSSFLIAFASPYWLQTYHTVPYDFKNMGLWEICFNHYYFREDTFSNEFDGCIWSFDLLLDNGKRDVFNPPFFVAVQVFNVANLILLFATVVITFLLFIRCTGQEDFSYWILTLLNTIMMGIVAALEFTTIVWIGVMSGDRQWMPRADLVWLSWGYAFEVMSTLFAIISTAYFGMEAKKYWGSAPSTPHMFDIPLFRQGDAAIEPDGTGSVFNN